MPKAVRPGPDPPKTERPSRRKAKASPERVAEIFRALCRSQPRAQGRAGIRQSLHPAGRGRAVGPGHRRRRQQGHARPVQGGRHAQEDAGAGRGRGARAHQDHRPLPHQGQERHRPVAEADRRAWRRGAARARGAGGPSRRRPQDRQCRAQYRLRRADAGRGHPRLPRGASPRPGVRQDAARGRAGLAKGDPRGLSAQRPPLAHPAWPLCLPGAQTQVRCLCRLRPVQLGGQVVRLRPAEGRRATKGSMQ